MIQFLKNDSLTLTQQISSALDYIETYYPEMVSMVFTEVHQNENGEEVVFHTEPCDLVLNGYENVLRMAHKVETVSNKEYRVLTRNETRLGELYHNENISKLDYTNKYGEKCTILELQWSY